MQATANKQMAVFPVLKSIYRSLMRSEAHIEGTLTILFIGRSGVRICPLLGRKRPFHSFRLANGCRFP